MDIINEAGISKPFFYTFYSSLEELVIRVLDYQKALLYQFARAELERADCLEPTAEIQARNLAGYLAGLREKEGSRARVHALS